MVIRMSDFCYRYSEKLNLYVVHMYVQLLYFYSISQRQISSKSDKIVNHLPNNIPKIGRNRSGASSSLISPFIPRKHVVFLPIALPNSVPKRGREKKPDQKI